MSERRAHARRSGFSLPVTHAKLRPGTAVHLLDLSEAGALVQSARPLRPGGRVHLRIETARRTVGLGALVLRCAVWTIHPFGGISYRAALCFEARCPAFWEELAFDPKGPVQTVAD